MKNFTGVLSGERIIHVKYMFYESGRKKGDIQNGRR